MDTKQLERFCPWARRELIDAVGRRCVLFGLDDKSRPQVGPDADIVNGTVLTQAQKAQRSSLYFRIESMGYEAFCEAEAYGWFNRFAAIRYMELHGFLPSRVRMLSGVDGSFDPQCLRAVGELDLPGLDVPATLQLIVQNQADEAYRDILVAQCNELADCLPEVFGRVGGSDALTLPDGLLLRGEHDFLYHLVTDIPESDWQDVEVLGWMYQFYNSERKEDFFKSKRKAEAADIAPATQLFTPEWIVRYMVENSLGRLWMLNRPDSRLRDRMEYYVEPDAEHEDFIRIESPEDITLCDPACGSGHILSYAFELLFAIYEECGYTAREIPELILTKNLSGYEVDPRAAQIASLVLALRAREHDRRFFRREVRADVRVLESVDLAEGECGLPAALTDELAHLGEIGSLLNPTEKDVTALRDEAAGCEGDLFSSRTVEKLERALASCEALRRRFYVVVANPPYMGSSSFNPFMSGWVKKNYPDVKSDLCTCFIERVLSLAIGDGFSALVTSDTCMYLSSFEALRNKLIDESTLLSLVDTRGTNAHPDVFDANAVWVLQNGHHNGYEGAYFKLNHRISEKDAALLEAIKNPTCGWFYRRDASTFHQIPGSPIAYWASGAVMAMFESSPQLKSISEPRQGLATADNERFLRFWWEPQYSNIGFDCLSRADAQKTGLKWFPMTKGGEFRRWYGNLVYVVNWEDDGREIRNFVVDGKLKSRPQNLDSYFKPGLTWSAISSGLFAMRRSGCGTIPNAKGPSCVFSSPEEANYLLAASNTSAFMKMLEFVSPTLDYSQGPLARVPVPQLQNTGAETIAENSVLLSSDDWDSLETSWDFKRSPLL
ncbi:BREX-1 system adenine-specific DNA-methyltransferase PglX [Paratractidigestivibacter faecalis]|uniref:BREX-1 system adenine-specific DNA-methyltransferase PglX n=1 Tax=Paratractidigestivibacter faecalis TaxID=2292441 RepID=UPI003D02D1D9